jgi:hypothetical protein
MRLDVEKLGTVLVVLLTLVTLMSLGVYGSLKGAVGDLHAQTSILHADVPAPSRSPLGQTLAALLASDLTPGDAAALEARALELDHRADRLLEMTAVVALVGMLAALLTGRPAVERAQARDDSMPLANTSSNGSV